MRRNTSRRHATVLIPSFVSAAVTGSDLGRVVHEQLDEGATHAGVDYSLDLFVGAVRKVGKGPTSICKMAGNRVRDVDSLAADLRASLRTLNWFLTGQDLLVGRVDEASERWEGRFDQVKVGLGFASGFRV